MYTTIAGRPNVVRYTIRKKSIILDLVNRVNGNIRNSVRIPQFIRVCEVLNVPYIVAAPLTKDNAWLTGMFDADGTIYLTNNNISITVTNKLAMDLHVLTSIFQGNLRKVPSKDNPECAHRWVLYSEKD